MYTRNTTYNLLILLNSHCHQFENNVIMVYEIVISRSFFSCTVILHPSKSSHFHVSFIYIHCSYITLHTMKSYTCTYGMCDTVMLGTLTNIHVHHFSFHNICMYAGYIIVAGPVSDIINFSFR